MVMGLWHCYGKSISHRKLSLANGRKVHLDIIKPYFFTLQVLVLEKKIFKEKIVFAWVHVGGFVGVPRPFCDILKGPYCRSLILKMRLFSAIFHEIYLF
jgi:hypothetical protein